MAFDKIFRGAPTNEITPASEESPNLGIDVVNDDLYVNTGKGWTEIGGGGSGTITGSGTTGFIPKFTTAQTVSDSTIDDGVTIPDFLTLSEGVVIRPQLAVGPSMIDPLTDWGPGILIIADNENDAASLSSAVPTIPLVLNADWYPTADVAPALSPVFCQLFSDNNLDGQATRDTQLTGMVVEVNSNGTEPIQDIAALRVATLIAGPGASTTLAAITTVNSGTQTDCNSMATRFECHGGTVENYAGHLLTVEADGGVMGNFQGFLFDTNDSTLGFTSIANFIAFYCQAIDVTGKSTTEASALHIENVTGAANNYAIKSNATCDSDFAGPIATTVLKAHTVYSAAGIAIPPAATGLTGSRAFVSDSTAAAVGGFGAAYVSGGTHTVPVWCDGTAWLIG